MHQVFIMFPVIPADKLHAKSSCAASPQSMRMFRVCAYTSYFTSAHTRSILQLLRKLTQVNTHMKAHVNVIFNNNLHEHACSGAIVPMYPMSRDGAFCGAFAF